MRSFAVRSALFALFALGSTLALGCASGPEATPSETSSEPSALSTEDAAMDLSADLASEPTETMSLARTYRWEGIKDNVLFNHGGVYINVRVAMQVAYDYRYATYARAYVALTCKVGGKPHDCSLLYSTLQLNLAGIPYVDHASGDAGSDGFYSKYGTWHHLNYCGDFPDDAEILDPDNDTGPDGLLGISVQLGNGLYVAPWWYSSKDVCPPPLPG